MTNEEIITRLNSMKDYYNDRREPYYVGFDAADNEALDLAIKTLEQTELNPSYNSIKTELKPCDTPRDNLADTSQDCISRQEVNELVDELDRAISDERCYMSRGRSTAAIMQDIIDLPSVTPKAEWIPVTERLPEEEGYYFVTFFSDEWHSVGVCGFHKYDEGKMVWDIDNIIAWMSLPELYKESDVN